MTGSAAFLNHYAEMLNFNVRNSTYQLETVATAQGQWNRHTAVIIIQPAKRGTRTQDRRI